MADTNQGAIFGVLDRIYKTILNIDGKGEPRKGLLVSIEKLGKPINPKDFANPWTPYLESGDEGDDPPEDDDPSLKAAYETAMLVDQKLANSATAATIGTNQKISTTWQAIVNGAQIAKVVEPQGEEKEDLVDAYDLLWSYELVKGPRDPETRERVMEKVPIRSRTYQRYLDCKKAYEKAEEKYGDAYAESLVNKIAMKRFPLKGKRLISSLNDAMDDWNSVGKKYQVEAALDVIAAQGRNPTAGMISDAKNRFKIYQAALGGQFAIEIPYSYVTPTNWCDEDSEIWNNYSGNFSSSESHSSSKTSSWHAELSVNYGLFSGSGSASGSQTNVAKDSESKDTEISLKWAAIDINRPWLDTSLLNFGGWYLKLKDALKGSISGGDVDQLQNLPCIPTKMIIVKDVVVKNSAIQDHFDSMSKSLSTEVDMSYGPFVSASGGYSSDQERQNAYKKMAKEGLSIPGMQLIGWVSEVTPTAPQLDTPKNVETAPEVAKAGTAT